MARPKGGQAPRQGRKGNKKYGRNAAKCARYRAEGRREKNKARRAAKRLRRFEKRAAALGSTPGPAIGWTLTPLPRGPKWQGV